MTNLISQTEAQQKCYILSGNFVLDDLLPMFERKFSCSLEPAEKFRVVYYDTFDWRLYRKDEALVLYQYGQKQKLSLEDLSTARVKEIAPLPRAVAKPLYLDSLPSAMRESIASTVAMRALLPVVKIDDEEQKLLLRDKHDKIVVRLSIEKNSTVSVEHGRKKDFPERMIVSLVKGYQAEFKYVRNILDKISTLTPCKLNLLDMALAGIGRHAGDYSSKVKIKFNPNIQSVQAVKSILQHLLSAMEMNEPGMIARLDTEFLHDYRIAVRRSRSILSQMKGVFPEDGLAFFRKEFAWLGAITTPARDLDVYLLEFEKLQNRLAPEMRDALLPFKDFLREQQEYAYKELVEAVTSERYKKLKQELNEFFKHNNEAEKNAPDAKKDIHQQADERIWRSYKRVKKEADRLTPDSPAQDFHDLRKSCKKLRYLLEFFQFFYPEKKIGQLIKQLKILQDNLGEFQDMDVQNIALKNFAKMMEEKGIKNADTYMAMGVLADGMEQRKKELQHAFIDCYKKFSAKKYQQLFKKLFKPDMKPEQELPHESIG